MQPRVRVRVGEACVRAFVFSFRGFDRREACRVDDAQRDCNTSSWRGRAALQQWVRFVWRPLDAHMHGAHATATLHREQLKLLSTPCLWGAKPALNPVPAASPAAVPSVVNYASPLFVCRCVGLPRAMLTAMPAKYDGTTAPCPARFSLPPVLPVARRPLILTAVNRRPWQLVRKRGRGGAAVLRPAYTCSAGVLDAAHWPGYAVSWRWQCQLRAPATGRPAHREASLVAIPTIKHWSNAGST